MSDEPLPPEERGLLLKERELNLKEREVAAKEKEVATSKWRNPVVLGLFAAALGLAGNILVTRSNNANTQKIEHLHAQSTLILEAIKTNGNTNAACNNLTFFASLELLDDPKNTIRNFCPSIAYAAPSLPVGNASGISTFTGEVHFSVRDQERLPVAGVDIHIKTPGVQQSCSTDEKGDCKITIGIAISSLDFSVRKVGYVDLEQGTVGSLLRDSPVVDVKLIKRQVSSFGPYVCSVPSRRKGSTSK